MKLLSQIYSILLYPMFMPTYAIGLAYVGINSIALTLPIAYIVISIIGTFFITCCIPFSAIVLLVKKGKITDVYLMNRRERIAPYLCCLVSYAFWYYFIVRILGLPSVISGMAIAATLAIAIVTLINIWWKISAHLAGMGALLGSVISFSWYYGIYPLMLILVILGLSLLLMYARLILKQHTSLQVVCGFLLGILLPLISVPIFS